MTGCLSHLNILHCKVLQYAWHFYISWEALVYNTDNLPTDYGPAIFTEWCKAWGLRFMMHWHELAIVQIVDSVFSPVVISASYMAQCASVTLIMVRRFVVDIKDPWLIYSLIRGGSQMKRSADTNAHTTSLNQ